MIFKDPLGAFQRGQQGIAVRITPGSDHNGAAGVYGNVQSAPAETPIAPRLPIYAERSGFGQSSSGDYYSAAGYTYNGEPYPMRSGPPPQNFIPHGIFPSGEIQHNVNIGSFHKPQIKPTPQMTFETFERQSVGENDGAIEIGFSEPLGHWSNSSEPSTARTAEFPPMFARNPSVPFPIQNVQNVSCIEAPETGHPEEKLAVSSQMTQMYTTLPEGRVQDTADYQLNPQAQFHRVPAQPLWANELEEEYFDVDSDDEEYGMKSKVGDPMSYNLGPLIAMSANHSNGGMRSMTNFLNDSNVLATYRPSYAASPLMDPQTARIFCHFITATAPTLTVCERRPSNPAVIFSGVPVPKSQRSLWSYTLPMLALSHQGLLHSMLAMASLHISKLQNTSPTPSLKHYHYALRRVAKALGNQKKRKDVATLAATLLLGFYEVTTAEHNKWNSHLSGARELVMDIDFAGTAKKIENHRCRQEEAEANSRYGMFNGQSHGYQPYMYGTSEDFPAREDRQLNENLISSLIGWKLKYNQYGQIIDDSDPPPTPDKPLMDRDIESFEIQCDLFWWYAKQDMYQSIVSGNRLL